MLLPIISLAYVAFVAFPESKDALLDNSGRDAVQIESSGSLGLYYNGKCHQTYGNETITNNQHTEWCSNVAKFKNDPQYNPWIQYSLKGKQMKVSRYTVRNGCCDYLCCCAEENGKIVDYGCCCYLYSYSLQGSNDNKTWTVLHKVEQDRTFNYCGSKTFEINGEIKPYRYIRFVLDEEWPNCPKCMQINQIELYGQTINDGLAQYDTSDDDETISIIGRIKQN